MRALLVAPFVLAATPAHADLCHGDPLVIADHIPASCPLRAVVAASRGVLPTTFEVTRGTATFSIAPPATIARSTRRVFENACDGDDRAWKYRALDVDAYTIDLGGLEVGDRLHGALGDITIYPEGTICPEIASEPRCWPTTEDACTTPYRSPRCGDDIIPYIGPTAIGAHCPAQLVASAPLAGPARFELMRPPPDVGPYELVETQLADPEPMLEHRTEVTCTGNRDGIAPRLVYSARFDTARPGDLIRIRDDEAYLAQVSVSAAETCTPPFRTEWCWVEPTCPDDAAPRDDAAPADDGGCSTGAGSGGLLGVLVLAISRRTSRHGASGRSRARPHGSGVARVRTRDR